MKPSWILTVPVLSTKHVSPSTYYRAFRSGITTARDSKADFWMMRFDGAVLYCDIDELMPILQWFRQEFSNDGWVRFDPCGEVLAELPVYED